MSGNKICLVNGDKVVSICIDGTSKYHHGIRLVAEAVAGDVEGITGKRPSVITIKDINEIPGALTGREASKMLDILRGKEASKISDISTGREADGISDDATAIIAGTLDDSIIKDLSLNWDIKSSLDNPRSDEWERYQIKVVGSSIVIAGSDRRGVMYGLFHISQDLCGASPWTYFANVVPRKLSFNKLNNVVFESISSRHVFVDDCSTNFSTIPRKLSELSFTKEELEITSRTPSVKYRGIFLNDEAPSLTEFVKNRFGEYNYLFYANVCELLIRLKANFLWPAMWNNVFSEDGILNIGKSKDDRNLSRLDESERDDQANLRMADHYGVVIGFSHHEPMCRSGSEWQRIQATRQYDKPTKDGVPANEWNYFLNRDNIYDFWYDGFKRNKDYGNLVTIGMRGENDSQLRKPDGSAFTLNDNIELLKNAIRDQKGILREQGGQDAGQVLVIYKEVEEYWYGSEAAEGLNAMPELENDIMVLCEDNNGYLRTLPREDERDRRWGMYYHFDYNGGPKTYMWINVTPLQRVWDNMTMAYEYDIRELWVVNVGDLKPMELPISYFCDLAYDYGRYGIDHRNITNEYTKDWVRQQFPRMDGEDVAATARLLTDYADMNACRKCEHIDRHTFSPVNYDETNIHLGKAIQLEKASDRMWDKVKDTPDSDAFFQLVHYPAKSTAVVNKVWMYMNLNRLYADRGSTLANEYARRVTKGLRTDRELMAYYNDAMSGGYWKNMMSQNHYDYKAWHPSSGRTPVPVYVRPEGTVERDSLACGGEQLDTSVFGGERLNTSVYEGEQLIVDVSENADGFTGGMAFLPTFESSYDKTYEITLSNGGNGELGFKIEKNADWIIITEKDVFAYEEDGKSGDDGDIDGSGTSDDANIVEGYFQAYKRFGVSVDWNKLGADDASGRITISSGSQVVWVFVSAKYVDTSGLPDMMFIPANGVVAINANHYSDKKAGFNDFYKNISFEEIEDYGKYGTTMKMFPVTASLAETANAPYLEYRFMLYEDGEYTLTMYFGPSNNVYSNPAHMRYGLQLDGGDVMVVDSLPDGYMAGDNRCPHWGRSVLNAGRERTSRHVLSAGLHTMRVYGMDAGLLFQKMALSKAPIKDSFFGHGETHCIHSINEQTKSITSSKI